MHVKISHIISIKGFTFGSIIIACIIYSMNLHNHILSKFNNCQEYSMSTNYKKTYNLQLLNQPNNVNSIPGITGPGVPNLIRSTLSKKYGPINESATSFYGAGSGIIYM